jgi:hypothetical protein
MKRKTLLISASILAVGALGTVSAFAATTGSGKAVNSGSTVNSGSWGRLPSFARLAEIEGTAGTASTSGTVGTSGAAGTAGTKRHSGYGFAFGGANLASILGVTSQTLKSDLEQGHSLAQIAEAKGSSEQILIQDIESAERTKLDSAVQSSKLTATQEQTILSKMNDGITKFVEQAGGFPKREGFGGKAGIAGLSDIVSILGIDKATLQADLKNGESILEIAQSKDISEQTLASDLENKLKTKLDTSVKAGKLTQVQEDTMLQKFSTNIENVLNHKGGNVAGNAGLTRTRGGHGHAGTPVQPLLQRTLPA